MQALGGPQVGAAVDLHEKKGRGCVQRDADLLEQRLRAAGEEAVAVVVAVVDELIDGVRGGVR